MRPFADPGAGCQARGQPASVFRYFSWFWHACMGGAPQGRFCRKVGRLRLDAALPATKSSSRPALSRAPRSPARRPPHAASQGRALLSPAAAPSPSPGMFLSPAHKFLGLTGLQDQGSSDLQSGSPSLGRNITCLRMEARLSSMKLSICASLQQWHDVTVSMPLSCFMHQWWWQTHSLFIIVSYL